MSFFKKLFGTSDATPKPTTKPELYNGYTILPTPQKDGGAYRIAAVITKEFEQETKTHELIRADTVGNLEEAEKTSLLKAKMVIDQVGDGLFRTWHG